MNEQMTDRPLKTQRAASVNARKIFAFLFQRSRGNEKNGLAIGHFAKSNSTVLFGK
jgi:hypothetical protein